MFERATLDIELLLPKPPSLNEFYGGKHYSVRIKHKDKYWKEIAESLEPFDKWTMQSFSIDVRYNCRYDVDNAICCAKFLADYLRNKGYVEDDTPKYFTSQSTTFDSGVAKDKFLATIKCKNITLNG